MQLPQIWPFDAHLLDQGWQQTRGQQACPTGAMRAIKVEDEEMARMARDESLEVMKPELGTKPRVYYRNLWRYCKCFIGGSVAGGGERRGRCVEGASVRLIKDGQTGRARRPPTTTATSNSTELDENSGRYTVEVSANGRAKSAGRQSRRERFPRRDQAVAVVARTARRSRRATKQSRAQAPLWIASLRSQ